MNLGPERCQGKLCYLEELETEGDSHYRHAEDAADDEVGKCQLDSADDDPEQIDDEGHGAVTVSDFSAEGPEGEL